MKNVLVFSALVFTYTNLIAQGIPVSHSAEKKNVVLEDFTGMYCVNCPNGHFYANKILTDHPGDAVVINVHTGGYAEPQSDDDPDFRTQFGSYIENLSDLTGYPSAAVNRHIFPSYSSAGGTAIVNRGYWGLAADSILDQDAAANVGAEVEIDAQTNILKVRVQVYYTGNPKVPANNRINVALLQDNIEGPQTGMNNNSAQVLPNGKYLHKHMLRHMLTGNSGKQMPTVSAGVTIEDSFSYALPAHIRDIPLLVGDLKVAVFVTDGLQEIITGHQYVPVFVNLPGAHSSKILSAAVENNVVCGFTAAPVISLQNFGTLPLTSLYFDYSVNGGDVQTMYWTGNIASLQTQQVTLNSINYYYEDTNSLVVNTYMPNGMLDPKLDDDNLVFSFNSAPAASQTVTMSLQLDYWGEEVTWKIFNSAGATVYSGGPYTNTPDPNSGPPLPAPITQTFNLDTGDCYMFVAYDSYPDGILGTNTGFTLTDDKGLVIVEDFAKYNAEGKVPFGVNAPQYEPTSIFSPVAVGGIDIFPNPATDKINVNLNFTNDKASTIYLTDMLGKRVQTIAENQKLAGNLQFSVAGFTPGIYFLNAEVEGKHYTEKILVNR